jgi:hypothetical protein
MLDGRRVVRHLDEVSGMKSGAIRPLVVAGGRCCSG